MEVARDGSPRVALSDRCAVLNPSLFASVWPIPAASVGRNHHEYRELPSLRQAGGGG
ncbi:MAG: hypothetical protein AAFS10_18895 [Myxococcota bacterium]